MWAWVGSIDSVVLAEGVGEGGVEGGVGAGVWSPACWLPVLCGGRGAAVTDCLCRGFGGGRLF